MQYSVLTVAVALSFLLMVFAASYPSQKTVDFTQIKYHNLTKSARKQVDCLAENIYFEAAHEPYNGKVGVAMVTLNRVHSGSYPDTICDVVHQKTRFNDLTVCQFSWLCDARILAKRLTVKNTELYYSIRDLAVQIYLEHERMEDVTRGALFYHAVYVQPGWRMPVTVKIGQHIFYRPHRPQQPQGERV
jgi:spore germination cell wall hydrolase CwlJ-like protein